MIRLYGIKNCDTMKKARRWLGDADVTYEFHDYKKSGIDAATLKGWCEQVGWEILLNRRGLTWRRLDEAQKQDVDEARAIALMVEFPSMIKRPVLEMDGRIEVGFSVEKYERFLYLKGGVLEMSQINKQKLHGIDIVDETTK